MSDDAMRCEALRRSIGARMLMCDEAELRSLDRQLIAIEKRRDILPDVVQKVSDRARAEEVDAGLRELRESNTWSPRPFQVIDGGRED